MPQNTPSPDISALSSLVSSLASNPEVMSMISSLSSGSDNEDKKNDTKGEQTSDILPAIQNLSSIPALSSLFTQKGDDPKNIGKKNDPRINLLLALKPYLNHSRQDAIDKFIKFSSVSELITKLK